MMGVEIPTFRKKESQIPEKRKPKFQARSSLAFVPHRHIMSEARSKAAALKKAKEDFLKVDAHPLEMSALGTAGCAREHCISTRLSFQKPLLLARHISDVVLTRMCCPQRAVSSSPLLPGFAFTAECRKPDGSSHAHG